VIMKKIVMSLLAITAFGMTATNSQTARAEGWIGSSWFGDGLSGTMGNGSNDEGFVANFYVDTGAGAPAGTTKAVSVSGTLFVPGATNSVCFPVIGGANCPTTIWAFTLCQNGEFLTGNIVTAYLPGGVSITSNATSNGSGIWRSNSDGSWTSQGTDTGFCPTNAPVSAGGMALYQF
jgi:hypothetical protein